MLDILKSDIRKLFTVRSTYILMIIATIIMCFMAFYIEAWWGKSGSPASRLSLSELALHELLANTAGTVATFTCIIAILQIGHEYRYNTIMHTLTSSSRRIKVYLSKLLTLSVFSLVASIITIVIAFGAYILGMKLKGVELPPQDFHVVPELLRVGYYCIAYGALGLFIGLLVRSLIVAIAGFFILPAMIEPLLGLLLRDNSKYLPISSLDQVVGSSMIPGAVLRPNTAVLVSATYLVSLGLISWLLFLRRDAN